MPNMPIDGSLFSKHVFTSVPVKPLGRDFWYAWFALFLIVEQIAVCVVWFAPEDLNER